MIHAEFSKIKYLIMWYLNYMFNAFIFSYFCILICFTTIFKCIKLIWFNSSSRKYSIFFDTQTSHEMKIEFGNPSNILLNKILFSPITGIFWGNHCQKMSGIDDIKNTSTRRWLSPLVSFSGIRFLYLENQLIWTKFPKK